MSLDSNAHADDGAEASEIQRSLGQAANLVEAGRPEEADRFYAVALDAALASGRHDDASEAFFGRIRCLISTCDLVGLRDVSRAFLDWQRQCGDVAGAVQTMVDLGYLEATLGDAARGITLLHDAIAYYDAEGNEAMVAACSLREALAHRERGELAAALDHAEDAQRTYRRLGDPPGLAEALRALGIVCDDLGRYDRAAACYREELSLLSDAPSREIAATYGNLGISSYRAGRVERARDYVMRAQAMLAAAGDGAGEATCLAWLGQFAEDAGRLEDALALQRRAAELGQADPDVVVCAHIDSARLLLALGRTAESLAALDVAWSVAEPLEMRKLQSEILSGRAAAYVVAGDVARAVESMRRAFRLLDLVVSGLAPATAMLGRGGQSDFFGTATRVALAAPDSRIRFELLERGRAAGLRRGSEGEGPICDACVPQELRDEEKRLRAALLQARLRREAAQTDGRLALVREARTAYVACQHEYEAVLESLQRHRRGLASPPDDDAYRIEDAQAALTEGQALVLYSVCDGRVHALVLTSRANWQVDLGQKLEMAPSTAAKGAGGRGLVEALAEFDVDTLTEPVLARQTAALRRALIDPLRLPSGTHQLLVSPEGVLAQVPFGLLTPGVDVCFVPSAAIYRGLLARAGRRGRDVLACGDPVANGRAALPGSRAEVLAVTTPGDARLLGAAASEASLRALLGRGEPWSAVHFACHGLLDERNPLQSALVLSPGPEDDGLLTAAEVFGLDLQADLVVLSACETGRGVHVAGEGLVGLSRAFLAAGAPRVLASLWRVDDEATEAFMTRFHRAWREGASVNEGLRAAREHVAADPRWSHPRFWAAWMLWGVPDAPRATD